MSAQTKNDRQAQTRRTIMAALVAVLVARLVAQIPVLADMLEWVDELIAEAGVVSVPALALLQAAVIAAVIWLYQRLAQVLGDRWPSAEKVMLGSSARPHYVPRYAVNTSARDGSADPDVWSGGAHDDRRDAH